MAARDPRTPWYAKAFMALIIAHTFSPIDLIPDFIPVLGYLDDLIIVPAGIALAIRMIPPEVMAEARLKAADKMKEGKPVSKAGAVMVVAVWVIVVAVVILWIVKTVYKVKAGALPPAAVSAGKNA